MAQHYLRRALRCTPTLGRCHESLARCRDTQQLFEEALFLRRCAATLTPDSEDYARAYFDTCRILKRSKEGLEFLRARTRQHGHKQAGPWMTLATALDSIRSSREAVTVLEEARAALPDNGELLLGAGALMAGWGGELRERGMRWVEAARARCPTPIGSAIPLAWQDSSATVPWRSCVGGHCWPPSPWPPRRGAR